MATSKERARYRTTKKWKEFRKQLIEESNHSCSLCGTKKTGKQTKGLQIHHLDPTKYGNESNTDCIVLCSSCHKLVERMIRKYNAQNYKPTLWSEYMKPMIQAFTVIDLGEHSENFKPFIRRD